MLIELTRKSIRVWADFRAEVTLKSVRDGIILLRTNMQIHTSSQFKINTQNLYELVALVNN